MRRRRQTNETLLLWAQIHISEIVQMVYGFGRFVFANWQFKRYKGLHTSAAAAAAPAARTAKAAIQPYTYICTS